ncbi:MAG: hypothetical protein Q8T13_20885 [Acidobacteriota bacterium]|nr:hypothetical protein [Acidobacteriota bacterium]
MLKTIEPSAFDQASELSGGTSNCRSICGNRAQGVHMDYRIEQCPMGSTSAACCQQSSSIEFVCDEYELEIFAGVYRYLTGLWNSLHQAREDVFKSLAGQILALVF